MDRNRNLLTAVLLRWRGGGVWKLRRSETKGRSDYAGGCCLALVVEVDFIFRVPVRVINVFVAAMAVGREVHFVDAVVVASVPVDLGDLLCKVVVFLPRGNARSRHSTGAAGARARGAGWEGGGLRGGGAIFAREAAR